MHTSLPEPTHVNMEEAKELKVVIQRLEKENEEMQLNLLQIIKEKDNHKLEVGWKKT